MSGKLRDIGIAQFLCLHSQFFLRPQLLSYVDRSVSQLQRLITTDIINLRMSSCK